MPQRPLITRLRVNGSRFAGVLFICLSLSSCGEAGGPTGPGPQDLTHFERRVIEEAITDRMMDLVWVADKTSGGRFPQLAFAYSLIGVDAGWLASVTVDPMLDTGQGEPFCQASILDDVRQCVRIRYRDPDSYDFDLYFTHGPGDSPRSGPLLTYPGEGPVTQVQHEPQPLRRWVVDVTPSGAVDSAAARIEERFSVSPGEGSSLMLTIRGDLEADFQGRRDVRARLRIQGVDSCESLRLHFDAVHGESGEGALRCGERIWASLALTPGQPVEVHWQAR